MSRSPERLTALALTLVLTVGHPAAAWADPADPEAATAGVEEIVARVEDVVAEVESLDGAESESKRGEQITVALTSDVLFALDRAVLTTGAKLRLRRIAERVRAESAGGEVRIEGHTDDQGSDAYNDALSLRRARAVGQVLRATLAGTGTTLLARGFGESRPKVPNIVDGAPVEANRARNRRVEIVFDAAR
ncbi:OmpA family protein [Streptosporangium sp. NPDC000239]|uniref:OmpA family protein n=1 Tax=Streptosporangium sp. NPDC000239 TaxID=3154248 RepID=UPI00332C8313